MNTNAEYLAVFLGSRGSPQRAAFDALPEADRNAKIQQGMAAWKGWMERHSDAIASVGGPLGATKKVSAAGAEDVHNLMSGFVVVRAPSHADAVRLFEGHPHFTIFPGDSIEIMPVLPIPGSR